MTAQAGQDALVFLDIETTGLEPDRHDVWDIGLIRGDTGEEIEWHIKPDLAKADPGALRVTGYHARVHAPGWRWAPAVSMVAERLALLTAGKHLVGAVPSFDAAFLDRFLRAHGQAPAWHYHLVDVEALAAGRLGVAPPWKSGELSAALGLGEIPGKHTGIGDARWAKAMFEAAMARPELVSVQNAPPAPHTFHASSDDIDRCAQPGCGRDIREHIYSQAAVLGEVRE